MSRVEAGRQAKLDGHKFENAYAELLGDQYIVEGASNTKVDLKSADDAYRYSLKNPSGASTQVALIVQNNFADALSLSDDERNAIGQFFGGDAYADYPRHRKTMTDMSQDDNQLLVDLLNNNRDLIFDILVRSGYKQIGDVNILGWATRKNDPNSVVQLSVDKLESFCRNGEWVQNETTFFYMVGDTKVFHLQMKGSGKKYTNGYHALMFHIHGRNLLDHGLEYR